MAAIFEVGRLTLSLHVRSRLLQLLLVLALALPWTLSLVDGDDVRGTSLFQTVCGVAVFSLLLPFVTLYLCVHAVHSDLEDRTATYLFTRPVSRISILLGKLGATVLCAWLFAAVLITSVFAAVSYSGVEWRDGMMPRGQTLWAMLLGAMVMVVGYTGYGALLGAFFRRPLLVAVVLCVLEFFCSRLPPQVGIQDLTVSAPVRRMVVDLVERPTWEFREIMVQYIGDGPRHRRRQAQAQPELPPMTPPLLVLLRLWGVTLGLGCWIYQRREYDSRPRE